MHSTQLNILKSLQHSQSRKFSELLLEIAETSDNLTHHLKQLQKSGFVKSPTKGQYALAHNGLIYLNNNLELGHDLFPTVSCMLNLHGQNGEVLIMRKLKQPHLNRLHLPTFGVESDASLADQISAFLKRYHITVTELTFQGVHRDRLLGEEDYLSLDKFFMVFRGTFVTFEQSVDDREFMALHLSELIDDPGLLPASKAVLARDDKVGFAESLNSFVGE